MQWIIVDDGSTDRTAEIIREFAARHDFIRLHRSEQGSGQRSFGSKDRAINAAYTLARTLPWDYVGMLDADIALDSDRYYEHVLAEFSRNPKLGICGGWICERQRGVWRPRKDNAQDSVAGGIQMFRRSCYERIGGYVPLHFGGEDWLAQMDARMAGYDVLACDNLRVRHYRTTSSAGGRLRGLFRLGMMDASFGSHPAFEVLKCGRRLATSPWILGAALRLGGFSWWKLSGRPAVLPPEKVAFLRQEQMGKVRNLLWGSRDRKAPMGSRRTASESQV
jgi:glycosyltransferase involved in cell wall biosynthesis